MIGRRLSQASKNFLQPRQRKTAKGVSVVAKKPGNQVTPTSRGATVVNAAYGTEDRALATNVFFNKSGVAVFNTSSGATVLNRSRDSISMMPMPFGVIIFSVICHDWATYICGCPPYDTFPVPGAPGWHGQFPTTEGCTGCIEMMYEACLKGEYEPVKE